MESTGLHDLAEFATTELARIEDVLTDASPNSFYANLDRAQQRFAAFVVVGSRCPCYQMCTDRGMSLQARRQNRRRSTTGEGNGVKTMTERLESRIDASNVIEAMEWVASERTLALFIVRLMASRYYLSLKNACWEESIEREERPHWMRRFQAGIRLPVGMMPVIVVSRLPSSVWSIWWAPPCEMPCGRTAISSFCTILPALERNQRFRISE